MKRKKSWWELAETDLKWNQWNKRVVEEWEMLYTMATRKMNEMKTVRSGEDESPLAWGGGGGGGGGGGLDCCCRDCSWGWSTEVVVSVIFSLPSANEIRCVSFWFCFIITFAVSFAIRGNYVYFCMGSSSSKGMFVFTHFNYFGHSYFSSKCLFFQTSILISTYSKLLTYLQ